MECPLRLLRSVVSLTLCVGVLGLAAAGCSSAPTKTQKVTGKVTMDGAPVKGATVNFTGAGKGFQSSGITGDDGTYHLSTYGDNDGAPEGEYTITVTDAESNPLSVSGKNTATVAVGANTVDITVTK